jgi:hypothetical protein
MLGGSGWLLPVAVLLYLLIVVPTALLCGFWQAVIVSLSAVVVQATHGAAAGASTWPPIRPTRSRWWYLCWWRWW